MLAWGQRDVNSIVTGQPLRVAVLCDSDSIEVWQREALQQLVEVDGVELAFAIVRSDAVARPPVPLRRRIGRHTLYNLLFRRVSRRCAAMRVCSLAACFPQLRIVPSTTVRLPKGRTALPSETLELIDREAVDVVVRFGFGILSGEILTRPRFGVWSFHHGDPAEFRGMPPGVWEMIRGAPTTGAIVQRLSETLDGGAVLAMARFHTRAGSYTRQLSGLLLGSAPLLAHAAAQCRHFGEAREIATPQLGPIYRKPRTMDVLSLLVKMPLSRLRGVLTALFVHQHWRVVAMKGSIEGILRGGFDQRLPANGDALHVLAEERGMFAADPFLLSDIGGSYRLLVERFDWAAGKGHIASADMNAEGQFSPLSTIIETPGHLSYPFARKERDVVAIYPEALADGVLRKYVSIGGSRAAEAVADLGQAVLDPTIVEHGGRYWMFYGGDADNTTLRLRHAPGPDGPWTEHRANPVKIDVSNARPAGALLRIGDMLVRPAQVCTPHYGRAIVFNRIDALTETCFSETPVARMLPAGGVLYGHGVHTISVAGEWLVFDQARTRFFWRETVRILRTRLHRLLVKQRP